MSFNATLIENPSIKVTLDESPELKVKILLLKGDKGDIGTPTDTQVKNAVDEWLDDHPEATTTVEDGAVTSAKLANSAYHNTAATFDTSKAYSSGDYAIYSGNLYRFTADKTAGAWDSTKVVAVALADDVASIGLFKSDGINLSNYQTIRAAINTNSKWTVSGSGYSKFIPIDHETVKEILVTSNATNGSVICLLKSDQYGSSGSVADFATGASRTFVAAGETRIFDVPYDCNCVNVLDNWSGDFLPQSISFQVNSYRELENESMVSDKIGLSTNNWTQNKSIFSTHFTSSGNQQGTVSSASASLKASGYIPVYGKMLELPMIKASDTTYPNYGMSLYDKDYQPIIGRAMSAIPNRVGTDYVAWVHIYLPENAAYFRTTYWSDSAISEYNLDDFTYNLLKEIPDEYKPITHELPVDTYMQNSIRRARQLTDIKWTPRVNIPRYSMINGGDMHFLDWFYADHEYVGIPYSGAGKGEGTGGWTTPEEWGYAHNWVGQCIPFDAFVTAARYPNSIFGETVGQTTPNYDSSPFGIVCTALVNHAVNGPLPLRGITNFFDTSDNVFRLSKPNNTISALGANDIMIGDFLYTNTHVIMITDIMRDANGNVTHVEMSEATTVGNGNNTVLGTKFGGVARRKMWEYNTFKSLYGAYVLYRRTTFYGIAYTASKYVDTGNEGNGEDIVDLPCIPYLGNGAVYKVGYIHNSKVCIGATGFTTLVVTKDGSEFGTFDVTGLSDVSVGFSEVGSYEAYLTNGNTRTMACRWTVEL